MHQSKKTWLLLLVCLSIYLVQCTVTAEPTAQSTLSIDNSATATVQWAEQLALTKTSTPGTTATSTALVTSPTPTATPTASPMPQATATPTLTPEPTETPSPTATVFIPTPLPPGESRIWYSSSIVAQRGSIWSMDVNGGNERQVPGLVAPDYYEQLSPSRAQMVYWDYKGSVILYDMGTLEKTAILTDTEAEYASLEWSYDGKYIAVLKTYPSPYRTVMDVLDIESREIVWTRQEVYAFYDWSPTDNVLLANYYDEAVGQGGWWFVNIENGTIAGIGQGKLDENRFSGWDFSPDGQKLAAVPYSTEQDGYLAIYEPMDQSWHKLLPQASYEDYEVWDRIKWSPDGRQIAYVASFRKNGQAYSDVLFVVDVATNEHRLLVAQQYPINILLWSPDSQEILFDEGSKTHKVSVESGLVTLLDDGSRVGDILAWIWEAY